MQIVPFAHQFKKFVYQSAVVSHTDDTLTFTYHFQVMGTDDHSAPHVFTPSLSIAGVSEEQLQLLGNKRIEHYAFLLGLCELLKTAPPTVPGTPTKCSNPVRCCSLA